MIDIDPNRFYKFFKGRSNKELINFVVISLVLLAIVLLVYTISGIFGYSIAWWIYNGTAIHPENVVWWDLLCLCICGLFYILICKHLFYNKRNVFLIENVFSDEYCSYIFTFAKKMLIYFTLGLCIFGIVIGMLEINNLTILACVLCGGYLIFISKAFSKIMEYILDKLHNILYNKNK